MNKIYIVGDTHGEFNILNKFINRKQPDMILQCGDFGYWPAFTSKKSYVSNGIKYSKSYGISDIKPHNTKIHWCDGNHEDHWSLKDITNNEIIPNVIYQHRGSVITLPDGRNVLFMGGAYSIDKSSRTEGFDWFREETISHTDMMNLPDCRIDIVVSHTCPESFFYGVIKSNILKVNDPSCQMLDFILDEYKPSQWFFGHWHVANNGYKKGCHWTCLNCLGDTGGWLKL